MSYSSRKRSYDQGGCVRGGWPPSPAYNVQAVTNTSSSSCENNGRRTPPSVLGSTPSVAALFFKLRDSYGWQHCRPVCSETRYSSRISFFAYPTTPPLGGFPSEYRHPVWHGKTRMAWLYPMVKKISKISLFVLTQLTNVTNTQTDRQTNTPWRHRPRLCIASRGKN